MVNRTKLLRDLKQITHEVTQNVYLSKQFVNYNNLKGQKLRIFPLRFCPRNKKLHRKTFKSFFKTFLIFRRKQPYRVLSKLECDAWGLYRHLHR